MSLWQSLRSTLGHDLILFPLYALADRLLHIVRVRMPRAAAEDGRGETQRTSRHIPLTNYVRIPTLATGLLLTAAFYLASAPWYVVRTILRHRRSATTASKSPPETPQPAPPGDDPQPRLA
jgi:hypothetical protein